MHDIKSKDMTFSCCFCRYVGRKVSKKLIGSTSINNFYSDVCDFYLYIEIDFMMI